MLKCRLLNIIMLGAFFGSTAGLAYADQALVCEIDAEVMPSQQFQVPTPQFTRLKNDGAAMLLIGIKIQSAKAIERSKHSKPAATYCASLIGQQKDAYLSGRFDEISIQNGDQIKLKNIHYVEKVRATWPDFYFVLAEPSIK